MIHPSQIYISCRGKSDSFTQINKCLLPSEWTNWTGYWYFPWEMTEIPLLAHYDFKKNESVSHLRKRNQVNAALASILRTLSLNLKGKDEDIRGLG